jgi:hypothetical protein
MTAGGVDAATLQDTGTRLANKLLGKPQPSDVNLNGYRQKAMWGALLALLPDILDEQEAASVDANIQRALSACGSSVAHATACWEAMANLACGGSELAIMVWRHALQIAALAMLGARIIPRLSMETVADQLTMAQSLVCDRPFRSAGVKVAPLMAFIHAVDAINTITSYDCHSTSWGRQGTQQDAAVMISGANNEDNAAARVLAGSNTVQETAAVAAAAGAPTTLADTTCHESPHFTLETLSAVMGSPAVHMLQPPAALHLPRTTRAELVQDEHRCGVATPSTGLNTAVGDVHLISTTFINMGAHAEWEEELGSDIKPLLSVAPSIASTPELGVMPRLTATKTLPLTSLDTCWAGEKMAIKTSQLSHNSLSDTAHRMPTATASLVTTACDDTTAAADCVGCTSPQHNMRHGSGGENEGGITANTAIPLQPHTPLEQEACSRHFPSATIPWWRRFLPVSCCFGGSSACDEGYM